MSDPRTITEARKERDRAIYLLKAAIRRGEAGIREEVAVRDATRQLHDAVDRFLGEG